MCPRGTSWGGGGQNVSNEQVNSASIPLSKLVWREEVNGINWITLPGPLFYSQCKGLMKRMLGQCSASYLMSNVAI